MQTAVLKERKMLPRLQIQKPFSIATPENIKSAAKITTWRSMYTTEITRILQPRKSDKNSEAAQYLLSQTRGTRLLSIERFGVLGYHFEDHHPSFLPSPPFCLEFKSLKSQVQTHEQTPHTHTHKQKSKQRSRSRARTSKKHWITLEIQKIHWWIFPPHKRSRQGYHAKRRNSPIYNKIRENFTTPPHLRFTKKNNNHHPKKKPPPLT